MRIRTFDLGRAESLAVSIRAATQSVDAVASVAPDPVHAGWLVTISTRGMDQHQRTICMAIMEAYRIGRTEERDR